LNIDENKAKNQQFTTSQDDSDILKHASKARRHLFLIRHGQYQIKEKEKHLQVLTELGREQAEVKI
jgi:hypothetical protein